MKKEEKIYLDSAGYEKYLQEIESLKEKIQKNACDMSLYASDDAYGDGWHDNFAYEEAMRKERMLFFELNQKLQGLNHIQILDQEVTNDFVCIGTYVEILFDGEDDTEVYQITGSTSSDLEGEIPLITITSPLGKAIYRKRIGEKFQYEIGNERLQGTILNIEIVSNL